MKNEDVKIGMKVVPFQKTVKGYEGLSTSVAWHRAEEKHQPFLYVARKDGDSMFILYDDVNYEAGVGGDYFNAGDFEPYIEKKKSIVRNIEHIITDNKTIVIIHNEDGTYQKGEARRSPQDKFDEQEGFRIAYCRAIGKEPFEKAVTVDNKQLHINRTMFNTFLNGDIHIKCKSEGEVIRLLNYLDSEGLTWNNGNSLKNDQSWRWCTAQAIYFVCYNHKKIKCYANEDKDIKTINYHDLFAVDETLSQFTSEELLLELKLRLN